MIELVKYSAQWPAEFQRERSKIAAAMGASALRIEHVGSTAVPQLQAKPVIDIQISVAQLHPLAAHTRLLQQIGYTYVSLPAPPDDTGLAAADEEYPFFRKPNRWPSSHHVHLCTVDSTLERNHIVFRNYLRDHAEERDDYAALKELLATEHVGNTDASREAYSLAKTTFVQNIIETALAAGYTR